MRDRGIGHDPPEIAAMEPLQRNITLGTAGHIDHGKTALVKLLTGCDTDRLKEEKERGMSIELGFAPCRLGDMEVGIVDVPGHENFIKTMVAGAASMDAVLLVIASDDGIMPQTREHLDILTLLGIRHGFVALTKVDIVNTDRRVQITEQIGQFLAGTFLEGSPIMPVSNITGEGLGDFYDCLKDMVSLIAPRSTDGVFRLPVERAFSVKGYGTVVAGVPVCGKADLGDEIVIFPQAAKGRIKTIQVYQRSAALVLSGQCAALNIPQLDFHAIHRGDVVTMADYFHPQSWFLCRLKALPTLAAPIKNGCPVKFHTGTSENTARMFLLEGSTLGPGREVLVQVHVDHPIVAGPNDRFIVRGLSPVRTIGGGTIVEGLNEKLRVSKPGVLTDARQRAAAIQDELTFVEYCIRTAPDWAITERDIGRRVKALPTRTTGLVKDMVRQSKVLAMDAGLLVHTQTVQRLGQGLTQLIAEFHQQNPASPGIEREPLLTQSGLNKTVFDGLLRHLVADRQVVDGLGRLALPDHRPTLTGPQQQWSNRIEQALLSKPFAPPTPAELSQGLAIPAKDVELTLKLLTEHRRAIRVDGDLFFHTDAIERARRLIVEHITKTGRLESVDFKYLVDTTRKFAIPLLDYFDKIGITRRTPDNTRYPGPKGQI